MSWAFSAHQRAEQRLGRPPHHQGSVIEPVPRPPSLPLPALSPALSPGPSPGFGLFQLRVWGNQGGQCLFYASCCFYLHLPSLGVLGEAVGAASWGPLSPGPGLWHPETGVPWPVVTQKGGARVCKCGCVCVPSILFVSLGNLGVGLRWWAMGCQVHYHPVAHKRRRRGIGVRGL